jgi:hypothetical protein
MESEDEKLNAPTETDTGNCFGKDQLPLLETIRTNVNVSY